MRSRIWTAPEHAWLTALARGGFASVWDGLDGEVVDRNRLRRVERITTPGGVAYLKRFFGVQAKNELKLRFLQQPRCTSQAMRERLVIDKLHAEGFRPPEVLAAGDETSFGHERRSLLLTASLDGHALADTDDLPETTVLEVAEHLGSVTSKGVFLPDLGLDHVFASPGSTFTTRGLDHGRAPASSAAPSCASSARLAPTGYASATSSSVSRGSFCARPAGPRRSNAYSTYAGGG